MRSKAVVLSLLSICFVPAIISCGSNIIQHPPDKTVPACVESCPIKSYEVPSVASVDVVTNKEVSEKFEVVEKRCMDGMVEIDGDYCPNVQETCLYFVDIYGNKIPENPHTSNRCGEFKYPTKCLSKTKIHKHFCIDKFEYPNVEGQRPQSWMSWYDVKKACETEGKRLCTSSEWTLSCEGPDMKPYPYGDGYHRDTTACNFDRPTDNADVIKCTPSRQMATIPPEAICRKNLDNLLVPSGSKSTCCSRWGNDQVCDEIGNLDEFVLNESGHPYRSHMAGGHIFGVRNNCRAKTDAHNEWFHWYESSGRCCKDID